MARHPWPKRLALCFHCTASCCKGWDPMLRWRQHQDLILHLTSPCCCRLLYMLKFIRDSTQLSQRFRVHAPFGSITGGIQGVRHGLRVGTAAGAGASVVIFTCMPVRILSCRVSSSRRPGGFRPHLHRPVMLHTVFLHPSKRNSTTYSCATRCLRCACLHVAALEGSCPFEIASLCFGRPDPACACTSEGRQGGSM